MGAESGEEEILPDLAKLVETIAKEVDHLEFQVMLGGAHDRSNAYLQINAGAGGVDSCDWASMLLRMYLRWSEARGFEAEELSLIHI